MGGAKMSNFYLDKMEELKADGIDFIPIWVGKGVPPIIRSYTKEKFESVQFIPKTNYRCWKMVDGIKQYID